jgi:hypothetical protein
MRCCGRKIRATTSAKSSLASAGGPDMRLVLQKSTELVQEAPLPRHMVSYITGIPGGVSWAAADSSLDLDHSKLLQRFMRAAACCCLLRKPPPAHPNTQRRSLNRQTGPAELPQRSSTVGRRVSIGQVGMSGGFCHIVLRLVENSGTGPPSSAARMHPQPDHPPPGDQRIDKTDGA